MSNSALLKAAPGLQKDSATASGADDSFQTSRLHALHMPDNHEDRLEWVRKSYERFFEKVRELDALMGVTELN